jgi:hypothetical protein
LKNLKVLPKDMPVSQVIETMKGFTRALGVRCTYCHVGEEEKPLNTYDFASDSKDKKVTARAMIAMVGVLNEKTLPDATGLPDARVTCFTCHRGSTRPLTAPPAPASVTPPAKSERGKVGSEAPHWAEGI